MLNARSKHRIGIAMVALSAIILCLAAFWALGPREPVPTASRFSAARIGPDVGAFVDARDSAIADLAPWAAREIVWAYPASRARTPIAIVYIHGFSGSKVELRPVPDMVAKALGANLYFTRLAGHGRSEAAMADATVADWVDDLAEAVAIGRRLGEKIIIIGTSTGGALATYGASIDGVMDGVAGMVLVSPNYGVRDWRSFLLTMPYARQIVPMIHGDTYGEAPRSDAADTTAQTYGWTRGFPTVSLLPMAALAQAADAVDAARMSIPTMFVYSPADSVVDERLTADMAQRWGAPHTVLEVTDSGDPGQHLVAGDARSPQTNGAVADAITRWIQSLD